MFQNKQLHWYCGNTNSFFKWTHTPSNRQQPEITHLIDSRDTQAKAEVGAKIPRDSFCTYPYGRL